MDLTQAMDSGGDDEMLDQLTAEFMCLEKVLCKSLTESFAGMSLPSFSSAYCSSEDPMHPFEYLFRNDTVSGWASLPNPRYPIECVVDLKSKFILTGLEIIAHQSMIPNRVDLYGTRCETLDEQCTWESIGFFNFNSNERSQWKARELKRIKLDHKRARYLRMVISDCHRVPPNRDNRCSLISLEIQGRRDTKPRATSYDDMVADLRAQKQAAVEEENYAAAADFKEELDQAIAHETELRHLFDQKARALANEEYLVVDSIVNRIMSIVVPPPPPEGYVEPVQQWSPPPIQEDRPIEVHQPEPEEIEEPVSKDPSGGFFLTEFRDQQKVIAPPVTSTIDLNEIENQDVDPEPIPDPAPKKKVVRMVKERLPNLKATGDNRPLGGGGGRVLPNFHEQPKKDDPDELSEENRAEADALIELFGESPVAVAYSNGWSNKVEGYKRLCELVKGLKGQNNIVKGFRGLMPLMRKRFNDGLKAVYCSAVEQTIGLVNALELPPNEFPQFVHQLLPLAMSKLGDSNARINESANQFVIWCAEKDPKFSLNEVVQWALKPPASPNQYHLLMAKMTLLKMIIEKHGIGAGGKVKLAEVMALVVPCLESRKAEVRQQSFDLLVGIYPTVGSAMEKHLTGVPRLVRDQLKAAVSKTTI